MAVKELDALVPSVRPPHMLIDTWHGNVIRQRPLRARPVNLTTSPTQSNELVTLENSPFSNLVFQNIGFVSLNPCLTHPDSLTWYKLMNPPE